MELNVSDGETKVTYTVLYITYTTSKVIDVNKAS